MISIVTPTKIGREQLLLTRCIPSVRQIGVQHVVVSDYNPELRSSVPSDVLYVELNDSWRNGVLDKSCGAWPWRIGSTLAQGEYIGFLGDDDEFLPNHVSAHLQALTTADFSISAVQFRVGGIDRFVIGPSFDYANLDSDGIMCRATALKVANWEPVSADFENAADYRLVRDWLHGGLQGALISETTAIHNDGWAKQ